MHEPRPSLAHRLAWLFPPIGLLAFAFTVEGPRLFDVHDPGNLAGGLAAFVYFATYAAVMARRVLRTRHL